MARPRKAPNEKLVNATVKIPADARLYLMAIAMTKQMRESELHRRVLMDYIEPFRGDRRVERAKKDALRYGLARQSVE